MAHEGRALCSCCPDLDREDCEAFAVYDAAGNDFHMQLRHQGLRQVRNEAEKIRMAFAQG